jgi:amino acid transporter
MARRNDLPSALARLHNKFLTPYYAILGTGVLMTLLVLFIPNLTSIVAISTFALLFNYSITNIAAFKLKEKNERHRVLPMFGLATCILLLAFLLLASTEAWIIGVAFLVLGTVYYAAWKKRRRAYEKNALMLR